MIGRTLSHYKVLEEISRGGMGIVYKALDLKLNREVALKVLPPELVSDPERKRRFVQEAQAAGALNHPNIAVIHEIDEIDGETFIAMELIEGKKLSEVLKRGPMPLGESLRIAREVAEGLAKAHEKGIVHRDLKPANVMLTVDGHGKIIDFGLAKLTEPLGEGGSLVETAVRQETAAGALLGTISYMSPEQVRGRRIDHRSDIFSFGVLLYEMVSGSRAFERETPADTLSAILNQPPPRFTRRIPRAVQALVQKCLQKDPAQRFENTSDLVRALHQIESDAERAHSKSSRLLAAIALVGMVAAGTWWVTNRNTKAGRAANDTLSVLVADFDNQTGEALFDGALEQALAISLEGAPFITAYDRARARQQNRALSPDSAVTLDETAARLVCQSQGIEVAIVGRVELENSGYRLQAVVLDPVTGASLAEATQVFQDKAGLLRAVDRLASTLRADLGDADPASRQAFAEETFTTASLEAMHAYATGQDLLLLGRYAEALEKYQNAITFDPEFGRAFAGMGTALWNIDRRDEARRSFDRALSLIHRMSDRERLRTRGVYYLLTRNYPQALDEFRQLVAAFPSDATGRTNLALAYFYARDFEQALDASRRSTILDSRPLWRLNQAIFATYAGQFSAATREAEALVQENPAFENAYVALAQARAADGNLDAALEVYRRLSGLGDRGVSMSALGLADLALYQGRLGEAEDLLKPALANDQQRNDRFAGCQKVVVLAQIHLLENKISTALDDAQRAQSGCNDVGTRFWAASTRFQAGDRQGALDLAAALGAENDSDSQAFANVIRAEVELIDGNPERAVDLLQQAQQVADTWLGRFALGRAYLQAGKFVEASSELDTCLRRRGEATALFLDDIPTFRIFPDVYYYLGLSQEGLGSAGAADSYGEYLRIKENGDETDLTIDAKRRLTDLQ